MSIPVHLTLRELRTLVRRLKSSVLTVEEAATLPRLRRRLEAALEGAEEKQFQQLRAKVRAQMSVGSA